MTEAQRIRRSLRQAGLTTTAIDAVWPQWWSDEAEASVSANAELRYSLARRLGLSPASLFDDEPVFVWSDDTRFKNLGTATERDAAVLASFSVAIGRCAVAATTDVGETLVGRSALDLRSNLLKAGGPVNLMGLLSLCWGLGVPVFYLGVFPLSGKRMFAGSARVETRHAILLGRRSTFPAQVAYYVAHEIGHIALGHAASSVAVVDLGDPLRPVDQDDEESAADRFALQLLTGSPDPQIELSESAFSAPQLAEVALRDGPSLGIDPGVLALCVGHRSARWPQVFSALRLMQGEIPDLPNEINDFARLQFDWAALPADSAEFLGAVMTGDARGDE